MVRSQKHLDSYCLAVGLVIRGFAGQVGHTHFADNGIQCGCGQQGCWVTEIGAAAIKRKLTAAGVVIGGRL